MLGDVGEDEIGGDRRDLKQTSGFDFSSLPLESSAVGFHDNLAAYATLGEGSHEM
jgi:hypothetical protein